MQILTWFDLLFQYIANVYGIMGIKNLISIELGWDKIYFKSGIFISLWSTKTFATNDLLSPIPWNKHRILPMNSNLSDRKTVIARRVSMPIYVKLHIQINSKSSLMEYRLHWRHDGLSNHQLRHWLLNRLFRRRSKKTSKLRITGLYAGKSPVTGEFPTQMVSNAENISIWWRHDVELPFLYWVRCACIIFPGPVFYIDVFEPTSSLEHE